MNLKTEIREKLARMLRYKREVEGFPLLLLYIQSAFLGNFLFNIKAPLESKIYATIHFLIVTCITLWLSQECEEELEEIDKT